MAFVVASAAVYDLLRGGPRTARVVAVLPAAVYLRVDPTDSERPGHDRPDSGERDAGWLALLARDAVRVPFGLVTAVPRERRPFAGVTPSTPVTVGGGEVRLGPAETSGAGAVGYRVIRYWDPGVPRLCGALNGPAVLRRAEAVTRLVRAIGAASDPTGAAVPGAESDPGVEPDPPARAEDAEYSAAPVGALESALAHPDPDPVQVRAAVDGLLGLGPGLTPAGDDVLAGALCALAAAADEPRRRALTDATVGALPRTVPISAALLRQACRGRTVPQVADLLRAVAGSGDLEGVPGRLAAVGHTSGAALALGVRTALRARAAAPSTARPLGRCA
jgi:hypothetical protein